MIAPTFSTDWFSTNIERWQAVLHGYVGTPVRAIEIGSYEGRSAAWFMANIGTNPEARLSCVDPWEDEEVWGRFQANLKEEIAAGRVRPYRCRSSKHLAQLMVQGSGFDFIYVDGS